jgi:L-2-hydroxyglutarate oxidase LhgO
VEKVDITIIGAGVVGLSIAQKLAFPEKTLVILEKNLRYGQESSSRNSEVVHAGIYYKPDTLKARLCVRGKKLLYDYCKENDVPYKKTGKLVLAYNDEEIKKLEFLFRRGIENGVLDLKMLGALEITQTEPSIKAKKAIFSPSSAILSADLLMSSLLKKAQEKGAILAIQSEVTGIKKTQKGYEIEIKNQEPFLSQMVINSAGHNADKIAQIAGIDINKAKYRQKFIKGEYFRINRNYDLKHLIYPTPNETSLGIHLTPDLQSKTKAGPNSFEVKEIDYEVNEKHREDFLNSIKKFLPDLTPDDLSPDTSGIRAKLLYSGKDRPDFIIKSEEDKGLKGFVNLIGIESPGLTSCLAIAEYVEDLTKELLRFEFNRSFGNFR